LDEIEHAAALFGLVIEESAIVELDRERAVGAEAELVFGPGRRPAAKLECHAFHVHVQVERHDDTSPARRNPGCSRSLPLARMNSGSSAAYARTRSIRRALLDTSRRSSASGRGPSAWSRAARIRISDEVAVGALVGHIAFVFAAVPI